MDTPITYTIVKEMPIHDVIELYKEAGWWTETPGSREIIPAMIKGSFCFMIATHNGKTIGMGRVISDGVSDAFIQDLIVKNEYRGHHIGLELARRLSQFCLDHHIEWIALVAEPNTEHFYEKLGYRVLKEHIPMYLDQGLSNDTKN